MFEVKAKEAKPKLDLLIERTKSYDKAGKTFLKQFEKCPESVIDRNGCPEISHNRHC